MLTYPPSSFDRARMIAAIKSVGKRELMREARIAMRTIDAAWGAGHFTDEELMRLADAAVRIGSRRRKREDQQAAAMLGVDAANLGKVVDGSRRPATPLLSNIATISGVFE